MLKTVDSTQIYTELRRSIAAEAVHKINVITLRADAQVKAIHHDYKQKAAPIVLSEPWCCLLNHTPSASKTRSILHYDRPFLSS